jgi:conjugative relaxase-like TrwC/TraI family protein
VLGIGKIRAGRETYHLDAVDNGVEEYYFGAREAPGVWLGQGTAALGLRGRVERAQLVSLLAGCNPTSGEQLTRGRTTRGVTSRLPGYDVSLRAPKSVSLLWGLTTDDSIRAEVQAGHDAAVRATLQHLEHVAGEARRGRNGSVRMPATGFIAAAFRHRTSRAGDPLLHTHLVIPNVVAGIDGRWSAPNGTMLYANAKSSGYVYQALLRGELTRRLGVAWGPLKHGAADLAGVPPEVIRAFSRRRVEIEERRDAIATRTGRQTSPGDATDTVVSSEQVAAERAGRLRRAGATTQLAALETRDAKNPHVDMRSAVTEWRERAERLGYGESARRAHLGVQTPTPLTHDVRTAIAARLVGQAGPPEAHLSARSSTWSRRDALMGWCSQLTEGVANLRQLDDVTDHFLRTHPEVVSADGQPGLRPGDGIRLANGGFVPARGDLVRYTTRRMRAVEEQLVTSALDTRADGLPCVNDEAVRRAVQIHAAASGLRLTPGQESMVTTITTAVRSVCLVVGRAGSGKTTALAVARKVWEDSGYPVRGAAKAAVAARHLELATGIPSQTLDSLLADLHRAGGPLPQGGVLVLDEAATVETPLLAELLTAARAARWKVVLIGDDQQLAEIDAGGGFRALRLRLGASELSDNVRQREEWERRAIDLLRRGQAVDALRAYIDHGRVAITDSREAACRLMVARWWRRRGDGGTELLQAHRNVDVRRLNQLAHERRVVAGEVHASVLWFGADIGIGDRVLTRLPARSAGILNGMRGTVVAADRAAGTESITVRLEDGATRRLDANYLRRTAGAGLPALDLAYATTIHRNQGTTADRAQVLLDPGLTADAAYVALSRGRDYNELVLIAERPSSHDEATHWCEHGSPRRALAGCLRVFQRSAAKHLSLDRAAAPTQPSVPGAHLDDLVAAWRRSTSSVAVTDRRSRTAQPWSDAASVPPTSDPHLLAIEELLAAPREDVVDAVARYRKELRFLRGQSINRVEPGCRDHTVTAVPLGDTVEHEMPGRSGIEGDDVEDTSEILSDGGSALRSARLQ